MTEERKGVEILGGAPRIERVPPKVMTNRGQEKKKEPEILDKKSRDEKRDVSGADVRHRMIPTDPED